MLYLFIQSKSEALKKYMEQEPETNINIIIDKINQEIGWKLSRKDLKRKKLTEKYELDLDSKVFENYSKTLKEKFEDLLK
jgi:predicted metal-dependent phosphoesterase TrpH